MVAEGNEKLERTKPTPEAGTKTPMKHASKAGRKTSMKLASQAKQSEETPEIAAIHQQASHTERIAMAQQHRLHMEQNAMAQYNRLQAQAGAARAAAELKWKEWWQPAKPTSEHTPEEGPQPEEKLISKELKQHDKVHPEESEQAGSS